MDHSLSPQIQNFLFNKFQLNGVYLAFSVPKEKLKEAIQGVRTFGFRGLNITLPHKETILEYLDETDPEASRIGAVNTVVHAEGHLIGYNTDVSGLLSVLKDHFGENFKGRKGVILGAGGSARAVAYTLLKEGISSLTLFNRTPGRVARLMEDLTRIFPEAGIQERFLKKKELTENLPETDLLINTLPEEGILDNGWILSSLQKGSSSLCLYDLNYYPKVTSLVKEAKLLNFRSFGGLSMLVAQAVESFSLWTGQKADWKEVMKTVAEGIRQ